jgi:predicted secreted protein
MPQITHIAPKSSHPRRVTVGYYQTAPHWRDGEVGRRALLTVAAVAAIGASTALASAGPVGPLPNGPTTSVHLAVGKTYTARLPKPKVAGRVWRIARAFNGKVVSETKEGETKQQVWVTFRAVGNGSTRVVFAMTRGETAHAYAARTFSFKVG